MSSINTNMAAMNALSALRNINMNMTETQGRISTGYKVSSGKDNAAYFQISTTMRSESSMLATINESMALAKGSMSTARLGAETLVDLAQQFTERLAFASQPGVDQAAVGSELQALAEQMITTINQSSFNGENLIGTGTADKTVTTGISRAGGTLAVTSQTFTMVDLQALVGDPTAGTGGDGDLSAIAVSVSTSTFTTDIGTSLVAQTGSLPPSRNRQRRSAWRKRPSRRSRPSSVNWSMCWMPGSVQWSTRTWRKRPRVSRLSRFSSSLPLSRCRLPTRTHRTSSRSSGDPRLIQNTRGPDMFRAPRTPKQPAAPRPVNQ
jgi:hypothetical protein